MMGAVVLGAGKGERLGGKDKLFIRIGRRTPFFFIMKALELSECVDEVVLVLSERNIKKGKKAISGLKKPCKVCLGGERRRDSVYEGLKLITKEWVLIHDGARPFLTPELIERGFEKARKKGAAIAAVPAKDTIKLASRGRIIKTEPRELLWHAQTPQIFLRENLIKAHEMIKEDLPDDASIMEKAGFDVYIFMGSYDNIKITTPEDVELAKIIARRYENRYRI